eukprot:6473736-Pyramimonas_sp.AAC.1
MPAPDSNAPGTRFTSGFQLSRASCRKMSDRANSTTRPTAPLRKTSPMPLAKSTALSAPRSATHVVQSQCRYFRAGIVPARRYPTSCDGKSGSRGAIAPIAASSWASTTTSSEHGTSLSDASVC